MIVLGVDPGLNRTGFAALRLDGARPGLPPEVVDAGHIKLSPRDSIARRLGVLDRELTAVIEACAAQAAAVESLFAHYRHPTTAIAMGHARGVILLALSRGGLEPTELKPAEVKRSITGNGHASKEQVQRAVQAVLALPSMPEPNDVADAMAIAYCAACRIGSPAVT